MTNSDLVNAVAYLRGDGFYELAQFVEHMAMITPKDRSFGIHYNRHSTYNNHIHVEVLVEMKKPPAPDQRQIHRIGNDCI